MTKYIPSTVEPKWQKKWAEDRLYAVDLDHPKKKYYLLVEFTYPSGDLHIGHWFAFAVPDVLGRMKRMQGYNVFFPNGFDAFGLPAENAAIQRGVHPRDWTLSNIENMKKQFSLMGSIHDWENEVITCLPQYYKWNQWIFLKMLERGIAYKGKALANWCEFDQTVLANENVEEGKCWRCHTPVVQKEVDQWFLKITDYAERLLWKEAEGGERSRTIDWPKPVREGQNSWIGKKDGINITYKVEGSDEEIVCFTTRPDTNFGATFIILGSEHPALLKVTKKENLEKVQKYVEQAIKKSQIDRVAEGRKKTGEFTGSYAMNDLNGERLPVWVSDFVLGNVGTGAVVGVPGHDIRDFEFAKEFNLPIIRVVVGKDGDKSAITKLEQVQEEEGVMVNSKFLNGMDIHKATLKIMDYLEEKGWGKKVTTYHLHDWSISRQRYWGTPIPVIYCSRCPEISNFKFQISNIEGKPHAVIPVPYDQLPVELPYEVDYAPKGKPPLATAEEWINVKCPNCGKAAKREVETMDTFVDSSWYFLRYLDNQNNKEIANKNRLKDWIMVDIYFGGAEHTLGHTLYSRFFYKFLIDIGVVSGVGEYAKKRVHHGVILGPDGGRMSKSRGNVVNPDQQIKEYGADAVRLYLCFIGPYDIVAPWNPGGISGVYHFLQRVWNLYDKLNISSTAVSTMLQDDLRMMHKTIKKVTEDLENIKFNTAVAALMEWLNHLSRKEKVGREEFKTLLLLLAPFAPHITEELWQLVRDSFIVSSNHDERTNQLTSNWSIHQQSWPKFDNKYLEVEEIQVVVQVNGRVRDILLIQKDIVNDKEVVEKMALEASNAKKFIAKNSVKKTIYIPGKVVNFVV